MKREVDPKDTDRALSYQYYIDAPMPMVTLFKTLDVTRLVRRSRKGYKFNMLMCWCVGLAASRIPEFRLLPVGRSLVKYDEIGVSVIVANRKGELSSCDIPVLEELDLFSQSYLALTEQVYQDCEDHQLPDHMMVGTSSLVRYNLEGVVNMYSGIFNNPFLIWGRYQRRGFRWELKLSFQFQHVQMDGEQACRFLEELQNCIKGL